MLWITQGPHASVHFTETAAIQTGTRYQIKGFLGIAIVNPAELGLITEAVDQLDLIDRIGREVTQGRGGIVAVIFLTIQEDATNLLALGFEGSVLHGDPGHFTNQLFSIRIRCRLVPGGINLRRIAPLFNAFGLGLDAHRTQLRR